MNAKLLFSSLYLAVLIAAPAQGALDPIEETLELESAQVDLPSYATDRVVVRSCAACKILTFQASENTVYQLGYRGEQVDLSAFREAVLKAQARDAQINLTYALDDKYVTRITLNTPSSAQ